VFKDSYNERLFAGGIRRFVHMGRFLWLAEKVAQRDPEAQSVVELGCYDGRILEHLPTRPTRYVGYDANWENGLDLARQKWSEHPEWEFRFADRPEQVERTERFDIGVCMETLEHVPDDLVDGYIEALSTIVRRRLYVTVPNEKHLAFVAKYLYHAVKGGAEPYAPWEVVNAALGRMDRVARHDHKGFDYEALIRRLERRFVIESVEGQPVPQLPAWISTGVSIVARPRVSG
jgi:2-polyprenyl-3-methyl-5-hydroxy-6-metoxy-1,4-benzoquinol methylase